MLRNHDLNVYAPTFRRNGKTMPCHPKNFVIQVNSNHAIRSQSVYRHKGPQLE